MGVDPNLKGIMALAEPLAHSMGFEILLAEETSENRKRTLRIFLEKPGGETGITIEECANFSRALDPILDVESEFEGKYNLEISSPGLDRPLVKAEHFEAHLGSVIQVVSKENILGRHKFKGQLKNLSGKGDDASLEILVDKKEYQIPMNLIRRANLDYFETLELENKKKKVFKFKKKD